MHQIEGTRIKRRTFDDGENGRADVAGEGPLLNDDVLLRQSDWGWMTLEIPVDRRSRGIIIMASFMLRRGRGLASESRNGALTIKFHQRECRGSLVNTQLKKLLKCERKSLYTLNLIAR